MANIWLPCLVILACFCVCLNAAKTVGYNLVSGEEFEKIKSTNPDSDLLQIVYFETGAAQGHVITNFRKNFAESGEYLKSFKLNFMTIDCKQDPVKEYCEKPKVDSSVFVFKARDNFLLDEMPMDILYSVDSIVANALHLALLVDVPTVHTSMELSAIKQRVKGKKNVIFGKVMAIGTTADRALMEGVFAYSDMYQFAMTTSRGDNLLGTDDTFEWEESDNRVWFFDCINADMESDCERSIFYGPMTVANFAIYLKTLNLPTVVEDSNLSEKLTKPLHETTGLPVAYLITTEKDYEEHKQVMEKVAKIYKGNLVFAMNITEPNMITDLCPRPPPCISIKPPGKKTTCGPGENSDAYHKTYGVQPRHPMGMSKPFNFVNMDELVRNWLEDYFFEERQNEDEDEENFEGPVPEQERQDDAVALAVEQMKPLKLDLTQTPALTDKTFDTFLDGHKVIIVAFTVRWDPRSLAFLHPYLQAAKKLMTDLSLESTPLARVECSDWPDVCDKNNVTKFPTIKVFRQAKFVADYKGPLETAGVMKAYKLHSVANPVMLADGTDMENFKMGKKPEWVADTLQAVVIAVIPKYLNNDLQLFKQVGRELQGEYLLGICTGKCAKDEQVGETSEAFAHKFNDPYQEEAHFNGDFIADELMEFIKKASRPILPELTPASLPSLYWKSVPFMILFRVPGEDSDRIEKVLAKVAQFHDGVVFSWMDASPDSVGSRLLHEYKFKETSPPNLVFLDHSTSRVCNYPDIEMIKAETNLLSNIMQWMLDLLKDEGSCNALKSGKFEPKVPAYDFLARIKENRQQKQDQARGRFGKADEFQPEDKDDEDEPENIEGGEEDTMEKFEDEMFGEDSKPADAKTHSHIEL